MKKQTLFLFFVALLFPLLTFAASGVEVTFDFHKKLKKATNQYAVWVENSKGELVRTLFVTSFTPDKGWTKRPSSLPSWRKFFTSQPVDGISGATPAESGKLSYTWDLKDDAGKALPAGLETYVQCSCPVTISGSSATAGAVQMKITGQEPLEQEMISNFTVKAK